MLNSPSQPAFRRLVAVIVSALVAVGLVVVPLTAHALTSTQRLDLRALVITQSGAITVDALATAMDAEGVAYTKVDLSAAGRPTIDAAFLSDTLATGPRGKFNAVFVPWFNTLGADEKAALATYESTFGVRQVDVFSFPNASVGLTYAWDGSLDGMTATVTPAGLAGPFSYLSGPVPIDNYDPAVSEAYGYLGVPAPASGQTFTTLLDAPLPSGGGRGALIGVFNDGSVEHLVTTFAANPYQTYFRVLTHGIISWATKDMHLGYSRNYFTVHVDDIFAADTQWDPTANCTPGEPDCPLNPPVPLTPVDIRMTPDDVTALVNWQNQNNFKLTMLFNGGESVVFAAADPSGVDPLTTAFLANKSQLLWMSHTYEHTHLGCVQDFTVRPWQCKTDPVLGDPAHGYIVWDDTTSIRDDIQKNLDFAQANGIPIDPTEITTGEHSGLFFLPQEPIDNPNFVTEVNALGLKVLGADASRDPVTRPVGNANTSPRHPMSLWYNVDTKAYEVDEYNYIYTSRANGGSGFCEDNPTIATCITPLDLNTGFDSYIVPLETRFDLQDIITNDPRALYIHQPNLTGERLIYPVLESILGKYRSLFSASAPIVQPTFTESTNEQMNMKAWSATPAGAVDAYLLNGKVTIASADGGPHAVPVTVPEGTHVNDSSGALFGAPYEGDRSAWISVGSTPQVLAVPNVLTPTVSGVAPAALAQGATNAAVTITGTGFESGATVSVSGADVTVGTVTRNSDTSLTASISVGAAAALGARDVTVTNPGGLSGTLVGALSIDVAPTVTSVSPTMIQQGAATMPVTITGTNLVQGAVVTVSGSPLTIAIATLNADGTLSTTISVPADADLGARDITVTNPDNLSATLPGALTVIGTPVVSQITPSTIQQGGANQSVTITGSNFDKGATVSVSGADVTVGAVTWNSATSLTVPISVAATAVIGPRDLTVTNPGPLSATVLGGLIISSSPTITSVLPNAIQQGSSNVAVTISGTHLDSTTTVTVSGAGVTAGTTTLNADGSLTVPVSVDATAALGARDITVTNPGNLSGTMTGGLTVIGTPVVSSLNPNSIVQGSPAQSVTITGSNFANGAVVSIAGGDVTVGATTWNSATSLTVPITVPITAGLGAHDVTVTNPGNLANTLTGGLTVSTGSPTVLSTSPGSIAQGQTNQTITINGSNFMSGATVAMSGTGLTLGTVTWVNSATMTVVVSAATTATISARDVKVTNPNTLANTLPGGFAITSGTPVVSSLTPNTIAQGLTNQSFTITGANFISGATVAVSGSGFTVVGVTWNSATSLTARLSVTRGSAMTARNITVRNPSGLSGVCTACLTVTNGSPSVTGITPNIVAEATTNLPVTISGSNFMTGATLTISGGGVTVSQVQVTPAQVPGGPSSISALLSVTQGANIGFRNVTVTNPTTLSSTLANGLRIIDSAPVPTSVNPNLLAQGVTLRTVQINGSGFAADFITVGGHVSFGDGVTVTSLTRNSATRLTAVVTVSPLAAVGPRDVTVTNGDGRFGTLTNGFAVGATPSISSVSPTTLRRGLTYTFTVNGGGFEPGATLTFSSGGITRTITSNTGSTITATITVGTSSTLGLRNVTITNPDGTSATLVGAVTVTR